MNIFLIALAGVFFGYACVVAMFSLLVFLERKYNEYQKGKEKS